MRTAVIALVLAWCATAAADGPPPTNPSRFETVIVPPETLAHETAGVLYLNRCKGGCTITRSGINDARSHSSSIPRSDSGQTQFAMTEFSWGDDEWNQIVQCVKEVYSPYALTVTDEMPVPGTLYNEAIIAGSDHEIGVSAGGIAPSANDCNPYSYIISYTFANDYPNPNGRVFLLCAVAAQESGHAYGLDHTYSFSDGSSGCKDPMTYRNDCGGQKFFRNDPATCGEYGPRPCRCGATQNSHLKLIGVLGSGTPITSPPVVSLTSPMDGAIIAAGSSVIAIAGAQRGIAAVELWLNDYKWATLPGVEFGAAGQPEAAYSLAIPSEVPDGVIDVVVKAKDDIDVATETAPITVTKGLPCTSSDTCLLGQVCDARGRCLWEPPAGQLGEACTFPQFCLTGMCEGDETTKVCTQVCVPGVADSCPDGFHCLDEGRVCWPGDEDGGGGGGCSSANRSVPPYALLGIAVLALLGFRRRRSARP
ncbi:MAG: MYXO-CTERM sorting domain-containing protein [Kofleriaceae bacterium]